MDRKGIILAGGTGTRLFPSTQVVSKQLLPVFDKPMIYYPLSTLMLCGVREILIISTTHDVAGYRALFGNGDKLGLKIEYATQESPDGIAQALIIGESFLNGSPSVLILGDNIFYGNGLKTVLASADQKQSGATIFAHHVRDPQRYGVVQFDKNGNAISLKEKPKKPKSNFAVTGLYFYDDQAPRYAKTIKPSSRNELEISELNNIYLKMNQLSVTQLNRGYAWFDTGTHESLLEANQFIFMIQKRQDLQVACLEEIAFKQEWIDIHQLKTNAIHLRKSSYGEYLMRLIAEWDDGSN